MLQQFFFSGFLSLVMASTVLANEMRLNHIQIIGTHNSYHIEPQKEILAALNSMHHEDLSFSLQYTHPSMREQLGIQNIRHLELDVFYDPEGNHYSKRKGLELVGIHAPKIPELSLPGFKVLHIQDLDFLTQCILLTKCLQDIKKWSDENPQHLPIFINIEPKFQSIEGTPAIDFTVPLPIDEHFLKDLDQEITSVIPREKILTPDDVRGSYSTLEKALLETGWPLLHQVLGKFIFIFDNSGDGRDLYLKMHPGLQDAVLFTTAKAVGLPESAIFFEGDLARIPSLVRSGYIVRTRADGGPKDAQQNNVVGRDAALSSGAHLVDTDYPVPDPRFSADYQVTFSNNKKARCNPLFTCAE